MKETALMVRDLPISQLKTNPSNARTHSKHQVRQIAASIKEFGFTNPILIDKWPVTVAWQPHSY
jgi:ParB-like chromosome segregation protein Spo0J